MHYKKMKLDIAGLSPATQSVVILAVGCILTLLIFYGFTNHFNGVKIPEAYNILTGK